MPRCSRMPRCAASRCHASPRHRPLQGCQRQSRPRCRGCGVAEFADRIRRNTRGIDLVCRLGGEEFVVVMPDCDLDMAVHVGERLRQCIAAVPSTSAAGRARVPVTASVGVSALEAFRRYAGAYSEAGRPGALLREAGRDATGWSPMPLKFDLGSRKCAKIRPVLGACPIFRLAAALEALELRLYTGCVFVTLSTQ